VTAAKAVLVIGLWIAVGIVLGAALVMLALRL
jgi:hypothetical protein